MTREKNTNSCLKSKIEVEDLLKEIEMHKDDSTNCFAAIIKF